MTILCAMIYDLIVEHVICVEASIFLVTLNALYYWIRATIVKLNPNIITVCNVQSMDMAIWVT